MKTKTPFQVFCTNEQKVTDWNHLPDNNNEVLLQCTSCGRFLKFPPGISRGRLMKMFEEHERVNKGQIVIDDPGPSPIVYSQVSPPPIKRWWEKILDALGD